MDLIETIRAITTLEGDFQPYQNASVVLKDFDPNEVVPTSKYVIVDSLVTIGLISRTLRRYGLDINQIDDIVEVDGIKIAPPVIEFDGEKDCIVDGVHRLLIARAKKQKVKCIYIRDASLPIIGKPISWETVKVMEVPSEDPRDRRNLRDGIEDTSECLRRYYRDLSVLGSLGRRPRKDQNG